MAERARPNEPEYIRALRIRCMHPSGCYEPRYQERLCRAHWDALEASWARYARPECTRRSCERPAAAGGTCTRHAATRAP